MNTVRVIVTGKNYNKMFLNVVEWKIIKGRVLYLITSDNTIRYISLKDREVVIE